MDRVSASPAPPLLVSAWAHQKPDVGVLLSCQRQAQLPTPDGTERSDGAASVAEDIATRLAVARGDDPREYCARLTAGHWVIYALGSDGDIQSWGWLTAPANVPQDLPWEFGICMRVAPGSGFLWDYFTMPDYRGRGLYRILLPATFRRTMFPAGRKAGLGLRRCLQYCFQQGPCECAVPGTSRDPREEVRTILPNLAAWFPADSAGGRNGGARRAVRRARCSSCTTGNRAARASVRPPQDQDDAVLPGCVQRRCRSRPRGRIGVNIPWRVALSLLSLVKTQLDPHTARRSDDLVVIASMRAT